MLPFDLTIKKKTKSNGMIETNAAGGHVCSTIRIDSVCVYKIFVPETHPFVVHTPLQGDREIYYPRGCDLGVFNFLIFYLYPEKKSNPKKTM
uniref:Uncharacterized protein n=1 Tax=Trichogramma kaykai TaxID=54128 RepID=A0ABD2WXE4_9HYME